jgi:hypothetical protein
MNIIHMDLRLHRGFGGQVQKKGQFQRGKRQAQGEKAAPNQAAKEAGTGEKKPPPNQAAGGLQEAGDQGGLTR